MNLVQEGPHVAVARRWEFGYTSQKNEQVAVQFEITEGPDAGRSLVWFGFFSDKTMQRTMEALRYCGWRGDDIMQLDGMGEVLVQIVVEHKVADQGKSVGKTFAEVRWVNRLGGGGPIKLDAPMDDRAKRMFAAKMKVFAKTVPAMMGGHPAPKGVEQNRPPLPAREAPPADDGGWGRRHDEDERQPPPRNDDDIPF